MGEKLEITSKAYLSPFGITRGEKYLFLTNAHSRTLFGRTSVNLPSRFISEIPEEFIETLNEQKRTTAASTTTRGRTSMGRPTPTRTSGGAGAVIRPSNTPQNTGGAKVGWAVGNKASHKVWGVGTVVSVRGTGDDTELDIAFPAPVGVKRLLAKFAPITKA